MLSDSIVCAVFPLPNLVFFPRTQLPLHIFEPRYRAMTADALAGNGLMTVAQLKPGWEPNYFGRPPIYEVATVGRIAHHVARDDGKYDILLEGIARVRVVRDVEEEAADVGEAEDGTESGRPYRLAECRLIPDDDFDGADLRDAVNELAAHCYKIGELEPKAARWTRDVLGAAGDAAALTHRLAAFYGSAFALDPYDRQCILEETNVARRAGLLAVQGRRIIALLQTRRDQEAEGEEGDASRSESS